MAVIVGRVLFPLREWRRGDAGWFVDPSGQSVPAAFVVDRVEHVPGRAEPELVLRLATGDALREVVTTPAALFETEAEADCYHRLVLSICGMVRLWNPADECKRWQEQLLSVKSQILATSMLRERMWACRQRRLLDNLDSNPALAEALADLRLVAQGVLQNIDWYSDQLYNEQRMLKAENARS